MYQENIVLCGASAYEQKYYFNQDFNSLPENVKKELQIMCVLFTEEIGGILTLEYDEEGNLTFRTEALEADARYDDIGSALKIKKLQNEKRELLEALEMYYRVFFLGEDFQEGDAETAGQKPAEAVKDGQAETADQKQVKAEKDVQAEASDHRQAAAVKDERAYASEKAPEQKQNRGRKQGGKKP